MNWAIAGLVILIAGLYYLPIKDAEIQVTKKKSILFVLFAGVFVLDIAFYIPFIMKSLLDGLALGGYISSGKIREYLFLGLSLIFYYLAFKFYSDRTSKIKEELIEEKRQANL